MTYKTLHKKLKRQYNDLQNTTHLEIPVDKMVGQEYLEMKKMKAKEYLEMGLDKEVSPSKS
jgi:hypothetical protein